MLYLSIVEFEEISKLSKKCSRHRYVCQIFLSIYTEHLPIAIGQKDCFTTCCPLEMLMQQSFCPNGRFQNMQA